MRRRFGLGDSVWAWAGQKHGWIRGVITYIHGSESKRPYRVEWVVCPPGSKKGQQAWCEVGQKNLRHLEPRLDGASKEAIGDVIGVQGGQVGGIALVYVYWTVCPPTSGPTSSVISSVLSPCPQVPHYKDEMRRGIKTARQDAQSCGVQGRRMESRLTLGLNSAADQRRRLWGFHLHHSPLHPPRHDESVVQRQPHEVLSPPHDTGDTGSAADRMLVRELVRALKALFAVAVNSARR